MSEGTSTISTTTSTTNTQQQKFLVDTAKTQDIIDHLNLNKEDGDILIKIKFTGQSFKKGPHIKELTDLGLSYDASKDLLDLNKQQSAEQPTPPQQKRSNVADLIQSNNDFQLIEKLKGLGFQTSSYDSKQPSISYSHYFQDLNNTGTVEIQKSFWSRINDPGKLSLKSFCKKWKDNVQSEKILQAYLVKSFTSVVKKFKLPNTISDTSLSRFIVDNYRNSSYSPDWAVHPKDKPINVLWVSAIGDTKLPSSEGNFPSSASIGQVLFYATTIINNSATDTIVTFLTTGEQICFWKVTKSKEKITYTQYGPVKLAFNTWESRSEGFKILYTLLSGQFDLTSIIPPDLLKMELSNQILESIEFIAEGASSHVYSVVLQKISYVLKVFKDPAKMKTEIDTIKKLEDTRSFTPIISYMGANWIIISPRGTLIQTNTKHSNFLSILETMDIAHENGILHRDIRPSNIIIDNNGNPYLIDWASSVNDDNQLHVYEGTYYTASDNILRELDKTQLAQGILSMYISHKSDDLISFVKTYIMMTVRSVDRTIHNVKRNNHQGLIKAWEKVYQDHLSEYHIQLLNIAESGKAKDLLEFMKTLKTPPKDDGDDIPLNL